ncbi:MAG: hypothetical protein ACJ74Z_18505 [Bryobacteraceae bacterium]|jgi:hypothetical protein
MNALDPIWETMKRQLEAARSEAAEAARSQMTNELNQVVRRLRRYESEGEWSSAILDGALQFGREVALFTCRDGVLDLRGQRNLNLAETVSFPAAAGAAFQNVITSRETVVALRTAAEVGEALSLPDAQERAHIVPIMNGPRVVALLFTLNRDHLDLSGIELIAGLASMVLERHSNTSLHTQIATHPTTANLLPPPAPATLSEWVDLSPDQRMLHVRAQRFARVKVAEMQLSRPGACRAGRQQRNLYVFLRREIDTARDTYRKQFMTIPSMVDYLHLELLRTAAENNEQILGADYPGQLV